MVGPAEKLVAAVELVLARREKIAESRRAKLVLLQAKANSISQ